jgi:NAD-dependent SIR2 family protein deacetylase
MQEIILEYDEFIRSVEVSQRDAFALLLGAGASINSGIPSAGECIWEWKRSIYLTKGPANDANNLDSKSDQVKDLIQKWLDQEGIYPPKDDPTEYSFYVKQCYPIQDDVRKYFQHLCERKEPSVGYKLTGLLHEVGMLQSIWTTNFDDLCRDAAIFTGNTLIDISLDSVDRIFRAANSQELLLIKLHGDYKYGELKNSKEELSNQEPTFRKKLIEYLNDKHLIVSGYSGRDTSIMEALKESYSQKGSGRLYWCGYGRNIPAAVEELILIARSNGRSAFYIPTDGFDKLMISLSKVCSKAKPELQDKYAKFLVAASEDINTPFSMDINRVDTIVKSNMFPLKMPQEVFQFTINYLPDERPWIALRTLTKGAMIVAVPFKKQVWALGAITDINNCFEGRIQGKVLRVPVNSVDVMNVSAFQDLMLSGIVKLFGKTHQLETNDRDVLWWPKHETAKMLNNVLYLTHKGIRLSLTTDKEKFYLSLMPDFQITTSTPHEIITKEIKQEVGRLYFDKIRNKAFNDYIMDWRNIFFKTKNVFIDLEFPPLSGTGLVFSISKSPAFATIMDPQSYKALDLVKTKVPKYLQRYQGIQYPEPLLTFAGKHTSMTDRPKDFHPMRGVSANKPYDFPMTNILFDGTIKLAVISPDAETLKFSNFLKLHQIRASANKVNEDYLIDFPGFYEAFGASLNIPDPGTENWSTCKEPILSGTLQETALQLRDHLIDRINYLSRDRSDKIIVICIPKRWLYYLSYDIENESYDLHDYIKAYCAEKGLATQFIQEETIENTALRCQINWWLSLSYFVKSMRTPWVLDNLDPSTAFAGIGYSISGKGKDSEIILGCSHIYNAKGQGLKYKLSKVEDHVTWDRQKSPHLSYNDAFKFGVSIRELFYTTMNELPKRVVVHKRTYFTQEEIRGLRDSLLGNGIQNLDLIEINFEDTMRFINSKINPDGTVDVDGYAVKRGTCVLLNKHEALLWTHGVVASVKAGYRKYYLGGRYIPGPLKIIKHAGNTNIGTIANEILGLSKMNWNSFDLYSQLPATVNSSNDIARIGKLLSKREGITYDYRYFI